MKTLQTLRKLIWSLLLPSGLLLVASLALYALTGKTEFSPELSGRVLGLGAKLFTIAGPVLVWGTSASVLVGIVYALFPW